MTKAELLPTQAFFEGQSLKLSDEDLPDAIASLHWMNTGLSFEMARRMTVFEQVMKAIDQEFSIIYTWRSHDQQARLYAQGRSTPGRIVTNAKPGQSWHNDIWGSKPWSNAIDMTPCDNGKPTWRTDGNYWHLWNNMFLCMKALDVTSGKDFKISDWAHFQVPANLRQRK